MRDSVGRFVVKWAGATAVGSLLALSLYWAAIAFVPSLSMDEPTPKVVAGAAIGVCFGLGQWLVMRRHIDSAVWWIAATAAGFAIGGALMGTGSTDEIAARGLTTETVGFVFGAAAGVSQWFVLRFQSSRALWWIPASVAAFGLGWFLNWSVDFGLDYYDPRSLTLGMALTLIPFVLISGLSLWWILSPTPTHSSGTTSA